MIELQAVSKVYRTPHGEVGALRGVSAQIGAGEFVAVRGPSGCGKSTLLMTVAGMARPSAGRVLFEGIDLYALSWRRRAALRAQQVGFVFQMFHLIPYLTVWENVLTPLLAGACASQADARAILERVGLTDRLAHRPAELSTGERQRVALARALLHRPKLILADEPTGNLDPAHAAEVLSFLGEFNRAGGTVLLATHEEAAANYAGRTLLLDRGKLVNG
ncbi:MAG: ABC transporter ATP-binding protein [Candidatus Zipacnadales bacterium]